MSFVIDQKGRDELKKRLLGGRPSSSAPMFDDYYLFLMLGLAEGNPTRNDASGLGEQNLFRQQPYPPADYKESWELVQGLVIQNVLRSKRIDLSDKKSVNEEIQKLISDDTESPFTAEFWDAINGFARTGALKIQLIPPTETTWDLFMSHHYLKLLDAYASDKINKDTKQFDALQDTWFLFDAESSD